MADVASHIFVENKNYMAKNIKMEKIDFMRYLEIKMAACFFLKMTKKIR